MQAMEVRMVVQECRNCFKSARGRVNGSPAWGRFPGPLVGSSGQKLYMVYDTR